MYNSCEANVELQRGKCHNISRYGLSFGDHALKEWWSGCLWRSQSQEVVEEFVGFLEKEAGPIFDREAL